MWFTLLPDGGVRPASQERRCGMRQVYTTGQAVIVPLTKGCGAIIDEADKPLIAVRSLTEGQEEAQAAE